MLYDFCEERPSLDRARRRQIPDVAAISGISCRQISGLMAAVRANRHFSACFRQRDSRFDTGLRERLHWTPSPQNPGRDPQNAGCHRLRVLDGIRLEWRTASAQNAWTACSGICTATSGSGRRRPRFAFSFGRLVARTSPSCHAVRRPTRNCSSVGAVGGAIIVVPGRSAISTSSCWAARISLSCCRH